MSTKKRILIISAVFSPEPVVAAKLSYDIANELATNYKISVISPKATRPLGFTFNINEGNSRFDHIIADSYTCPKFNVLGRLRESNSFGIYCYNYIKKHHSSINLIYSVTWPLFAQFYVVKAAKKFNIQVIVHVQDIYPESLTNILPIGGSFFTKILLPIDKYILKKSTGIIAISEQMKSYLAKTRLIDIDKISVIQNWQDQQAFIDLNNQTESDHSSNAPFTFMYLGNIGPLAGIESVIEAFIMSELSNSRLVIAGSGSMKDTLIEKAEKYKSNSIEFWDVPDGKVPEIQSHADVLLLPMKKGGASNSIPSKLPAYMFSKKPIIASVDKESDTADSITQARCGWVIPPEDIEHLSQAMRHVLSIQKRELNSLGENGYNYAINNFSKQENLNKLLLIFNENLDNLNAKN